MTPNEYQKECLRTASWEAVKTRGDMLLMGVMGMSGESGEALDIIKKVRFQGHELDREHLAKELGDVLWYVAVTAEALEYDLECIMELNIEKLRQRYPDGFTSNNSTHRKEGDV